MHGTALDRLDAPLHGPIGADTAQVSKAYRVAMPELTSRENWSRLYSLDV